MYGLGSVDPALLRALDLEPGHRVVDFCCGSGEPTLSIARWVGPSGKVLGVDVAAAMLRIARRRARHLRLRNVRFRCCDVGRFRHRGPRFDRAVSRYGLMLADDVSAALGRIFACLKPGGRIALAVWGPLESNPGARLRAEAVRPFLSQPPPDPEQAPNPLRLARPGLLPRLLKRAEFREVRTEAVPICWVYSSLEDYVRVQTENNLAETYQTLDRASRRRLCERLRRRFRPFQEGEVVRVPGLAWVASARR